MPITLDTEAVRRLADIGFLGISRGRFDDAEAVFAALRVTRPQHEIGPLGTAVARLGRDDPAGAWEVLRDAPQTEAVMAFGCIAALRAGERGLAEDLYEELSDRSPDGPLTQLAQAALEGAGTRATAGAFP
ncbi:MAG: tetratricopeptide repeat protein [Paracoccaceae bacterium]